MRRVMLTLSLFLAACGGETTATPEPEPTVAPEPTAPSAPTETPFPTSDAAADDRDITADLTAGGEPWTEHVTSATQTEPERVEIETSIVDPRGEPGSAEALQAIEVCEAAAAWLESQGVADPKISVRESDGTTFVTHGVPGISEGTCTEY